MIVGDGSAGLDNVDDASGLQFGTWGKFTFNFSIVADGSNIGLTVQ